MEINPTNNNTATQPPTASSQASANLNYDSFLKLLIAQMKNQDPTKPMDSTQYMAQLASFSNVEQTMLINNKLEELLTSSAIEQANQLIGHTLTSADETISGKVVSVRITNEGLVAKLDTGEEMAVGAGVIVS